MPVMMGMSTALLISLLSSFGSTPMVSPPASFESRVETGHMRMHACGSMRDMRMRVHLRAL